MKYLTCTKCRKRKPVKDFYKHKKYKDGLQSCCKTCHKVIRQKCRDTLRGYLGHTYDNMRQRCNNPNAANYKYYGGRGIKCLFKSLDNFIYYVVNILQVNTRGLHIDRINNDGHYEKGNIRFVTQAENNKNRRKIYQKKKET